MGIGRNLSSCVCLLRGALDISIGAKDAAVTCLWPQHGVAVDAFVKELAAVGRHLGTLCRAALRAFQFRRGNYTHLSSKYGYTIEACNLAPDPALLD